MGVQVSDLLRSSAQGGYHVIRKEAGPSHRTSSSVRLRWEFEEPKGHEGSFSILQSRIGRGRRSKSNVVHQQPDVNYIQLLEKHDFPCTVHA